MNVTIILSGGMDSATLLYYYKSMNATVHAITFDYGQRHRKEIESASRLCEITKSEHSIIDISGIKKYLKGSALTDEILVPHGHYESETMKATVVPNRNCIMLSMAYGIAACNGSEILACGVHSGDHHIYPDCRPEFISSLRESLRLGIDGHENDNLTLDAPFVNISKTQIAALGFSLGVPFQETWTCYEGGAVHCGKCGACQERKESFRENNIKDVTIYAE